MMQHFIGFLVPCLLVAPMLVAQAKDSQATATCNFDADKQVVVRYQRMTVNVKQPVFGREIPYDKVWAPGGRPMTLFANSPVVADGRKVPTGAYTLFIIPSEKQWELIISKGTDTSGRYHQRDDLYRFPMQSGELSEPESQFSIYFAHVAPDQCSMRLDLEKARAWIIFQLAD